jgi:hypothetical protein
MTDEPLTLTDVIHKARHQYEGQFPRHISCGDIAQEVERWIAARTADPGELRWRFVLWDGSAVEVALSDEDPADIGDPRTVTEDSTVYLTAVSGGVVSG